MLGTNSLDQGGGIQIPCPWPWPWLWQPKSESGSDLWLLGDSPTGLSRLLLAAISRRILAGFWRQSPAGFWRQSPAGFWRQSPAGFCWLEEICDERERERIIFIKHLKSLQPKTAITDDLVWWTGTVIIVCIFDHLYSITYIWSFIFDHLFDYLYLITYLITYIWSLIRSLIFDHYLCLITYIWSLIRSPIRSLIRSLILFFDHLFSQWQSPICRSSMYAHIFVGARVH